MGVGSFFKYKLSQLDLILVPYSSSEVGCPPLSLAFYTVLRNVLLFLYLKVRQPLVFMSLIVSRENIARIKKVALIQCFKVIIRRRR